MPPESSLTAQVAEFVVHTRSRDIPEDVMHLGKRSILDGLGLALAGNAAESGRIVRTYLKRLGCSESRGCTVIGTNLKLPARFRRVRQRHRHSRRRLRRHAARGRQGPRLRPAHASDGAGAAAALAVGESRITVGPRFDAGLSPRRRGRVQDRRGDQPRHYDEGFHRTGDDGPSSAAGGASRN